MADVKVPLLGRMPKGAVFAGGLAVVGVGGYLLYRHFTKPATLPPTGTGYGYGAMGYGYGSSGYGYGYSPYGASGFGGGIPFPFGGFQGYGYGQQQQQITTNAQWGAAAEAAMGSSGSDAIAAAIAKYLAGATVTPSQELTIQEAIAVVGPPPVADITGYPPKIHVKKPGPGPGPGGGNAVNPPAGLHVTKQGSTGVDVAWRPAARATSYQVTSTHGTAEMTGATSARIHSVGPKHTTAVVQVLAEPAANNATPAHLLVRVKLWPLIVTR